MTDREQNDRLRSEQETVRRTTPQRDGFPQLRQIVCTSDIRRMLTALAEEIEGGESSKRCWDDWTRLMQGKTAEPCVECGCPVFCEDDPDMQKCTYCGRGTRPCPWERTGSGGEE